MRGSSAAAYVSRTQLLSGFLRSTQGLRQVGGDVAGGFEANGEAHHVFADAGRGELLRIHLLMRGAGRVDDERLGVANIGEVAGKLQRLDEFAPRRPAALDAKADDRAGPFGNSRWASL